MLKVLQSYVSFHYDFGFDALNYLNFSFRKNTRKSYRKLKNENRTSLQHLLTHSVENCTFCEGLGIKILIFCQSRCTKAKFLIKIVLVSSSCNDIVYHTIIGVVHASVHGLHFVGYNPFLTAIIYVYIYLLKHVCVYAYIQIQE